eukprot:TRINITY_DN9450_c0_g1_i1.p1 TRINITY_DN9450_c0_g1~~TRINITY_DN9450_c0_g1_i1.p1  ORF type:complete len:116 (-),score=23.94 TRINITY_DN9450_c0_g1_i1:190-513(-)
MTTQKRDTKEKRMVYSKYKDLGYKTCVTVDMMDYIFSLLPFIDRFRCTGICKAWRTFLLDDEGSCFKNLNLTGLSGLLDREDRLATLLKRVREIDPFSSFFSSFEDL